MIEQMITKKAIEELERLWLRWLDMIETDPRADEMINQACKDYETTKAAYAKIGLLTLEDIEKIQARG